MAASSTPGGGDSLVARLLALRDSWLDLRPAGEGRPALRVQLRRPPEDQWSRLNLSGRRGAERNRQACDLIADYTVDWDGFSEAELLGAAIGSSDPLPFHPEVWRLQVQDNGAWAEACYAHLLKLVEQHIAQRGAAAKNSEPSSTPSRAASSKRVKTAS